MSSTIDQLTFLPYIPCRHERELTFYNVEEGELLAITALDLVGGVLLAFTVSFTFFFFGANWDLILASDLEANVIAEAKATRNAGGWAAVVFGVLTACAVVARFVVTNHIKKTSRKIDVR